MLLYSMKYGFSRFFLVPDFHPLLVYKSSTQESMIYRRRPGLCEIITMIGTYLYLISFVSFSMTSLL